MGFIEYGVNAQSLYFPFELNAQALSQLTRLMTQVAPTTQALSNDHENTSLLPYAANDIPTMTISPTSPTATHTTVIPLQISASPQSRENRTTPIRNTSIETQIVETHTTVIEVADSTELLSSATVETQTIDTPKADTESETQTPVNQLLYFLLGIGSGGSLFLSLGLIQYYQQQNRLLASESASPSIQPVNNALTREEFEAFKSHIQMLMGQQFIYLAAIYALLQQQAQQNPALTLPKTNQVEELEEEEEYDEEAYQERQPPISPNPWLAEMIELRACIASLHDIIDNLTQSQAVTSRQHAQDIEQLTELLAQTRQYPTASSEELLRLQRQVEELLTQVRALEQQPPSPPTVGSDPSASIQFFAALQAIQSQLAAMQQSMAQHHQAPDRQHPAGPTHRSSFTQTEDEYLTPTGSPSGDDLQRERGVQQNNPDATKSKKKRKKRNNKRKGDKPASNTPDPAIPLMNKESVPVTVSEIPGSDHESLLDINVDSDVPPSIGKNAHIIFAHVDKGLIDPNKTNTTKYQRDELFTEISDEDSAEESYLISINYPQSELTEEQHQALVHDGLEVSSSSGIPYTLIQKPNTAPCAILKKDDIDKLEIAPGNEYQQRLAITVMNMIDNVAAKNHKMDIKTSDPFVKKIAEQYLTWLNNQDGIEFSPKIRCTSSDAQCEKDAETCFAKLVTNREHEILNHNPAIKAIQSYQAENPLDTTDDEDEEEQFGASIRGSTHN